MNSPLFADGVIVDHVSHLIYAPKDYARDLYRDNPAGCLDALFKILQMITSSHKLGFGKGPMKLYYSEMLRDDLLNAGRVTFGNPALDVNEKRLRRPEAILWLKSNWEEISQSFLHDSYLIGALDGQVKREYRVCFSGKYPSYSMDHFVTPEQTLRLPSPVLEHFLQILKKSTDNYQHGSEDNLTLWLERLITTHYVIFGEYWLFSKFDYVPSLTRTLIPLKDEPSTDQCVRSLLYCMAIKILKKTKNRKDIVLNALDWCSSKEGEKVLNGFAALQNDFIRLSEAERAECIEEINAIINSEIGPTIDFMLFLPNLIKTLMGFGIPQHSISTKTNPGLRWLWKIRQPKAYAEFRRLTEKILHN